jgi:hypothetical protein
MKRLRYPTRNARSNRVCRRYRRALITLLYPVASTAFMVLCLLSFRQLSIGNTLGLHEPSPRRSKSLSAYAD